MHFSLLQSAFLHTAFGLAHHIPNQTEIATEEFCPKSLLRKQNEIDFIESHFQILHHLKIVHSYQILKYLDLGEIQKHQQVAIVAEPFQEKIPKPFQDIFFFAVSQLL